MTIYLDYNATTPLASEVLDSIVTSLKDLWGNPSSSYTSGKAAKEAISLARGQVSEMIHGNPKDIIFTSGGTESNNLVFHSVIKSCSFLPHVITTCIEHDSVLSTLTELEHENKIELTKISPVVYTGSVSVDSIVDAVRPNTALVSVMLANNETGIIQPLQEIYKSIHEINIYRLKDKMSKIYLHSDAAQAIGKITVDVKELGIDYLTIVGHKFYGPRIGALYVKDLEEQATPLYPMLYGGGQEQGYRPGTENTGMIVGLGKAAELVTENIDKYNTHMRHVRDYLEQRLKDQFADDIHFNSHFAENNNRLPNTCNISFKGSQLQGSKVLMLLEHCEVSLGAACHSNITTRPSPILLSCGIPSDIAINALRISVGRETSHEDIDVFINDVIAAVGKLTRVS